MLYVELNAILISGLLLHIPEVFVTLGIEYSLKQSIIYQDLTDNACHMKKRHKGFWRAFNQNFAFRPSA